MMKESIFYKVDFERLQNLTQNNVLRPICEIVLVYGMCYRGFRQMNLLLDMCYGRNCCFVSDTSVMKSSGLWQELQYMEIETGGNGQTCDTEEIKCAMMRPPSPEKYAYYENYYRNTGRLAHPIFVDDNKNIVSGYIAYLLAKQYNLTIEVYRVLPDLPVQKIVCGKVVVPEADDFVPVQNAGDEQLTGEVQIYGLDTTVSVGEVLRIRTEDAEWLMRIEHVRYVTGKVLQCDTRE